MIKTPLHVLVCKTERKDRGISTDIELIYRTIERDQFQYLSSTYPGETTHPGEKTPRIIGITHEML